MHYFETCFLTGGAVKPVSDTTSYVSESKQEHVTVAGHEAMTHSNRSRG